MAESLDPTVVKDWPRIATATAAAFVDLGLTAVEKRDFDAALQSFEEALAVDPDGAAAWIWCGIVQKERGDFKAAVASHSKALNM